MQVYDQKNPTGCKPVGFSSLCGAYLFLDAGNNGYTGLKSKGNGVDAFFFNVVILAVEDSMFHIVLFAAEAEYPVVVEADLPTAAGLEFNVGCPDSLAVVGSHCNVRTPVRSRERTDNADSADGSQLVGSELALVFVVLCRSPVYAGSGGLMFLPSWPRTKVPLSAGASLSAP